MKIEKISMDEIFFPEDDYKISDAKSIDKLKNIFLKFGQITPIVLQKISNKKYKIIDGVRCYIVASLLDWDEISAIVLDESLDEVDGDLIRIIYGQFKFDYDIIRLISLMHKVMEDYTIDELEKLLPYDAEELNSFKNLFDFDWNKFSEEHGLIDKKKPAKPRTKKLF